MNLVSGSHNLVPKRTSQAFCTVDSNHSEVDGFPKRDELRTIFVEHEIQEREVGEDAEGLLNVVIAG